VPCVKRSPKYIEYCEPCGEQAPGVPQTAKDVAVVDTGDNYKEVLIGGKSIDLAYVFVKTSDLRYENLASIAGCPATGVSPSLAVESETTTGVIITADDGKPPAPDMTPVTSIPSAYRTPLPPPAQVYVYSTTTREISWLPLVLAAGGGLITGAAATFVLLVLRRRRNMRPRAMNISGPAE